MSYRVVSIHSLALLVFLNLLGSTPTLPATATYRAQTDIVARDHFVYLPIVQGPDQIVLSIPGGDFEQSNMWSEVRDLSNRPLIVENAPGLPVQAHSGTHFAWLGAQNLLSETASRRNIITTIQPIGLPTDKVFLRFFYYIISSEPPSSEGLCVDDVVDVWVGRSLVDQGQVCTLYNTNGWVEHTIDISYLRGRTVAIEFDIHTDVDDISHVFIDDVSIINTR
jgi:hypothetical protein